ncbi:MAG: hypothetical protein M1816_008277 [Peltula sp. TS41687]|nr:MAG: hypothetical protein M1816_008277 [Peltula sp. TS41687]
MTSLLPPIPKLIFTILEPISLIAGFLHTTLQPRLFHSSQTPPSDRPIDTTLPPNTLMTVYQLGNLYLLLGLIGISVLYSTTEIKVVRRLMLALAVGDVGHLCTTASVLGAKGVVDVGRWNWVTTGNLGFTVALLAARVAYLAGWLGRDRGRGVRVRARVHREHI